MQPGSLKPTIIKLKGCRILSKLSDFLCNKTTLLFIVIVSLWCFENQDNIEEDLADIHMFIAKVKNIYCHL